MSACKIAVQLRHQHLVDLMLEDMVVPRHAVGHHHERRAFLHEVPRHERVQAKGAGTVTNAILFRQLCEVEKVRARHEPLHFFKDRVLRRGRLALAIVFELPRKKTPERVARLAVLRGGVGRAAELRVLAAEPHRRMFRPEPAREIARLVFLELVPLGIGIEQDEIRQLGVQPAERGGNRRPEHRPREARAVGITAGQQVDSLEMLRLLCVHAAHDVQLIRDARAARHQRGKMHARHGSRDAAKRTARRPARLWIPRLKLARRAAQPEKQHVLLRPLRGLRKERVGKKPAETRDGRRTRGREAF